MSVIRGAVLMVVVGLVVFCSAAGAGQVDKPGPKYHNLRYQEDFSYLGGQPGTYRPDFWDPIKWVQFGERWHVSVGGQARIRFESETNKRFGSVSPTQDAFTLQRYFLHMDMTHDSGVRIFLQGKSAHVGSRDRGGHAGLEDQSDIHQAFVDLPMNLCMGYWTFRLGRQELQYGVQRLISPFDWGNARRAFDGLKLFTDTDAWKVDIFAVRPVLGDRRNLDDEDENVDFFGLYSTWKGTKQLSADFYALVLKNNNNMGAANTNANGLAGRRTLYTVGTRIFGSRGNWDYETEMASQSGTFAGDRVRAWMATAGGGYTFKGSAWQPRIGLLYDYASGDRNPTDGTHSTFNQLYPLGHAWLGYMDVVGRSNVHAIKAQLKVKPSKKVTAWADFHTFFADQSKDALYSAGGAAIRRGAGGASAGSHFIGHELDLAMKVALNTHTNALVGYSHFWPGGFISGTGPNDAASFVYGQIEYKF